MHAPERNRGGNAAPKPAERRMTQPALPVTIRPLAQTDRAAWSELWTGYLAFYKTALPQAVYDRQFARLTDPGETAFEGLVAVGADGLAGLVHLVYHPHGWKIDDTCYLQDLFVAPAMRGRGIARTLMEAAFVAADQRGADGVYWTTQTHNATARALYDRVGKVTAFIRYVRA